MFIASAVPEKSALEGFGGFEGFIMRWRANLQAFRVGKDLGPPTSVASSRF